MHLPNGPDTICWPTAIEARCGGRVRMVAELLCHPADTATDAVRLYGAVDGLGHHFGGRGV
jgi:hypothetical protein